MCGTCGCGQPDHVHAHDHEHPHHEHQHGANSRVIDVEEAILQKNALIAERNRGWFEAKNITAFNLVSSPGSGKTTLLERTLTDLKARIQFTVIEGDQQTTRDAERIEKTGVPVKQINTGNMCHLEAEMIRHAVQELNPANDTVLMIENVGNLVCPSAFDLGEKCKIAVLSVTEGDDKPLKYPNLFHESKVLIITKIDLLPYVDFDLEKCKEYARRVGHNPVIFCVSAKTGEGMEAWYDWLKNEVI